MNTKTGQFVLGILLAQDILIVPLLIIINYLSGDKIQTIELIKQLVGGALIVGIEYYINICPEKCKEHVDNILPDMKSG